MELDFTVGSGVELSWFLRFSSFTCNICHIWWMGGWMDGVLQPFWFFENTNRVGERLHGIIRWLIWLNTPAVEQARSFHRLICYMQHACTWLHHFYVPFVFWSFFRIHVTFGHVTVVTRELWLMSFLLLQLQWPSYLRLQRMCYILLGYHIGCFGVS